MLYIFKVSEYGGCEECFGEQLVLEVKNKNDLKF